MEIGMIAMWSGAIVDIPTNYQLCDGTNGTPDLRDRFVVGAGTTYNPADTGGNINHNHDGTTDGHVHELSQVIQPIIDDDGDNYDRDTTSATDTFTTDNEDGRPPYYSLAYIQRMA